MEPGAPPTPEELTAALGPAKSHWDAIVSEFSTTQEWKRYSLKVPWSLRLLQGKRTIVWLTPHEASFQAGIILGDKAIEAAKAKGLPPKLQTLIEASPRYPEGTGIRIEVRTARDLATVRKLAAIKLAR
ncbi:MAG: DUF3788 domain-containing protein [Bryobacterales bacterium]|nr:DUF3788 domain-containing protein [Bryobacterales bacterium]